MKPPSIGITISRAARLNETGQEVPESFQDIEISGNRQGLLELAEAIRRVAESDQLGYHVHFYPSDICTLLRTTEFGLTITKNSLR